METKKKNKSNRKHKSIDIVDQEMRIRNVFETDYLISIFLNRIPTNFIIKLVSDEMHKWYNNELPEGIDEFISMFSSNDPDIENVVDGFYRDYLVIIALVTVPSFRNIIRRDCDTTRFDNSIELFKNLLERVSCGDQQMFMTDGCINIHKFVIECRAAYIIGIDNVN
jgi:hypothetical protein